MDLMRLREPFPVDEIEWRVARCGISKKGVPWCMVLAYITARAAQERLDEIFGALNWQTEYRPGEYVDNGSVKTGIICKLSVFDGGGWISKEDGAQCTDFEPWKGGISDAFKRVCASGYGIGRYLYYLDTTFAMADIERKPGYKDAGFKDASGQYKKIYWYVDTENILPDWAKPGGAGKPIKPLA